MFYSITFYKRINNLEPSFPLLWWSQSSSHQSQDFSLIEVLELLPFLILLTTRVKTQLNETCNYQQRVTNSGLLVLIEITRYIRAWLIVTYYSALKVMNNTKIDGTRKFGDLILLGGNSLGWKNFPGGFARGQFTR